MGENGINTLKLVYIGDDDWSRPVYRDQFNHLWKDTDFGNYSEPNLCSVTGNEFDGEPIGPICPEIIYEIQPRKNEISKEKKFNYQMLSMLRSRCDYFLGNGNRYAGHLSGENVKSHLDAMKAIWNSFSEDEKPEWLTWEQILSYEKEMLK